MSINRTVERGDIYPSSLKCVCTRSYDLDQDQHVETIFTVLLKMMTKMDTCIQHCERGTPTGLELMFHQKLTMEKRYMLNIESTISFLL